MSRLSDISILYVEDEDGVRNSVSRSLALIADNVQTAKNGPDALEQVKQNLPDLIITDIRMPEMDGLTLIEKLREEGFDIPIIVTTAFSEIEYLKKAIDLKVEKFINKPIRVSDLFDVIFRLAETITAKRELRVQQEELERYRQAIEVTNFVIRINDEGMIIGINKELESFLGLRSNDPDEIFTLETLFSLPFLHELLNQTKELKLYNKITALSFREKHFTVQITAFASILAHDTVQEITILLNDLSPVLQEKDSIIDRLYTDELTGLPNRQKIFHDLQSNESAWAMVIIDIERFSNFNYLYGFDHGDEILKQVATILQHYWPDEHPRKIYRSDSDHFAILIERQNNFDRDRMEQLATKMIEHLEKHDFTIGNVMNVSIGITAGASCVGKSDLFTEASIALEAAKESRKAFMCFSDLDGIKERFETHLSIQNKIKTALETGKILNYYQSIVDADGSLIKYEALVRMEDPDKKGLILNPYHFVEIAKKSKNYPLITKQVITTAFKDFGDGSCEFSVNLSFDDIINPDISEHFEELFKKYPHARVTLELLESEGLKDIQKTIDFCYRMKLYGASIAIDDFGSGYSNFVYFFDMPIDILKIDGSLIKRVHEFRGVIALQSIVTFARHLGIKTVAEFVEDEALFNKLKQLGIDMYQGYYFSEPVPFGNL